MQSQSEALKVASLRMRRYTLARHSPHTLALKQGSDVSTEATPESLQSVGLTLKVPAGSSWSALEPPSRFLSAALQSALLPRSSNYFPSSCVFVNSTESPSHSSFHEFCFFFGRKTCFILELLTHPESTRLLPANKHPGPVNWMNLVKIFAVNKY